MAMNGSIHRMIMGELEARRRESSYLLESRRKEIYNKIPRVEEIEQEIRLSGINNKEILSGTKSADKAARRVARKGKYTAARKKNACLLSTLMIPIFSNPSLNANYGDTGFSKMMRE